MAALFFAIAAVVVTIIASLIVARVPARKPRVVSVPAPRGARDEDAKREAEAEAEAADVADDADAGELSADEVEAAEKRK